MADGSPDNWWRGLEVAACAKPFLPPPDCATCLRPVAGQGEPLPPLIGRDGACESHLDPDDPAQGIPW